MFIQRFTCGLALLLAGFGSAQAGWIVSADESATTSALDSPNAASGGTLTDADFAFLGATPAVDSGEDSRTLTTDANYYSSYAAPASTTSASPLSDSLLSYIPASETASLASLTQTSGDDFTISLATSRWSPASLDVSNSHQFLPFPSSANATTFVPQVSAWLLVGLGMVGAIAYLWQRGGIVRFQLGRIGGSTLAPRHDLVWHPSLNAPIRSGIITH